MVESHAGWCIRHKTFAACFALIAKLLELLASQTRL